jgi:hypothetical protein
MFTGRKEGFGSNLVAKPEKRGMKKPKPEDELKPYIFDLEGDRSGKSWLRGVDLNHRPLGYEFNISFVLFQVVRELQQLTRSWFVLFRVVLVSYVRNLFAISCHIDGVISSLISLFDDWRVPEAGL